MCHSSVRACVHVLSGCVHACVRARSLLLVLDSRAGGSIISLRQVCVSLSLLLRRSRLTVVSCFSFSSATLLSARVWNEGEKNIMSKVKYIFSFSFSQFLQTNDGTSILVSYVTAFPPTHHITSLLSSWNEITPLILNILGRWRRAQPLSHAHSCLQVRRWAQLEPGESRKTTKNGCISLCSSSFKWSFKDL